MTFDVADRLKLARRCSLVARLLRDGRTLLDYRVAINTFSLFNCLTVKFRLYNSLIGGLRLLLI